MGVLAFFKEYLGKLVDLLLIRIELFEIRILAFRQNLQFLDDLKDPLITERRLRLLTLILRLFEL